MDRPRTTALYSYDLVGLIPTQVRTPILACSHNAGPRGPFPFAEARRVAGHRSLGRSGTSDQTFNGLLESDRIGTPPLRDREDQQVLPGILSPDFNPPV